jgi:microcystin-dependent protein
MGTPFLGELKIMSFNFAPKGWSQCNGQLLPINQNQALFSILGTTYGGDGRVNFALPDLRSRVPIHTGQGFTLGEKGGEENHTLNMQETPAHTHSLKVDAADAPALAAGRKPDNTKYLAESHAVISAGVTTPVSLYGTGNPADTFHPSTLGNQGGSQPHTNIQPYLTLNICIALQGIFPSQN